jgi:hypothetical protein
MAPLTVCRFSPRLETASGLRPDAEELAAFDELVDGSLLEAAGVVTPDNGLGNGGLPKGPEPAGGLPGW